MTEEYYWGEVTQSEMRNINKVALEQGWSVAINEVLGKDHPGLVGMVTDEDRVDWIHQISGENLQVLDIGSGWGQSSYLLASKHGHSVTSLELIPERAEFQTIRANQDGLENLLVDLGNILDSDFPNGSFDLATFIGVLEWIGIDRRESDPRDVQKLALSKVSALLKPGGCVCIGIENRIGFNNILGAKDHTGFSFTSLMPRWLASKYLKVRNAGYRANTTIDSYRTYTYSANGYRKLLAECGFSKVTIYISHPHYAHPRCLIPYKNDLVRSFFWKQYSPTSVKDTVFTIIFRGLSVLGVGHILAPHFVIIAEK